MWIKLYVYPVTIRFHQLLSELSKFVGKGGFLAMFGNLFVLEQCTLVLVLAHYKNCVSCFSR